jgi:hypothetical protein
MYVSMYLLVDGLDQGISRSIGQIVYSWDNHEPPILRSSYRILPFINPERFDSRNSPFHGPGTTSKVYGVRITTRQVPERPSNQ